MMGVVREVNETQVPACPGAACGTKVRPVTDLGFDYASLQSPILTDSGWVEGKISLLRKPTILGRRWTHVPKNQVPTDDQGTRDFKGDFQGCTSLVAQMVKRLPTMPETQVRSLDQEDPLEKEMATHSSTLA